MGDLSDADLDEIALSESIDMIQTPDRISMLAFDMVQEIRRRRPSPSDRTALATAVRELKERRGTYETQLRRFQASGSDPAVIATWERAVAQVEEAIGACERLGNR